jgi:hypothetical protein
MAGFRVCYFAIANPAHQFGETDRLYLFVGALAVGWISIEQVIKIFNSKDS